MKTLLLLGLLGCVLGVPIETTTETNEEIPTTVENISFSEIEIVKQSYFKIYDKDNNSIITEFEFRGAKAIRTLELIKSIGSMDKNGDEVLNYDDCATNDGRYTASIFCLASLLVADENKDNSTTFAEIVQFFPNLYDEAIDRFTSADLNGDKALEGEEIDELVRNDLLWVKKDFRNSLFLF